MPRAPPVNPCEPPAPPLEPPVRPTSPPSATTRPSTYYSRLPKLVTKFGNSMPPLFSVIPARYRNLRARCGQQRAQVSHHFYVFFRSFFCCTVECIIKQDYYRIFRQMDV
jgi:hypothetical protein